MFMLTAMLRGAVFAMKAGAGEPTVSDIWAVGCGVEQLCELFRRVPFLHLGGRVPNTALVL